jgi:AcrR family transcriptional regulator
VASGRKNDILNAAEKCFSRFGYDKTTLDDIGKMVGINKVSLYYYFRNKEAIFTEVVNRQADEFTGSLKKKVEKESGCREKILTWIREGFTYSRGSSFLTQLSMDTLKKLTPQLEELKKSSVKKGIEYFESILAGCREKNEIIDCNINKVASTIYNVIYSIKDASYMRAKASLGGMVDFEVMITDIVNAVSLMLDGIITGNGHN